MPNIRMNLSFLRRNHFTIFLFCFLCCPALIASISLAVVRSAAGAEIHAISPSAQTVNGFRPSTTVAGQQVEIIGSGFDTNSPHENHVYFMSSKGGLVEAQFDKLTPPTATTLTVITPYDAISGDVQVRVGSVAPTCMPCDKMCAPCATNTSSNRITVVTSFSGIVQDDASPNNGIPGAAVRLSNSSRCVTTTAEGAFVMPMPGEPSTDPFIFVVDGTTAATCYPWMLVSSKLVSDADYHKVPPTRLIAIEPEFCKLFGGPPCIETFAMRGPGTDKIITSRNAEAFSPVGASALRNSPPMSSAFVAAPQSAAIVRHAEAIAKMKSQNLKAGQVSLQIPEGTTLKGIPLGKLSVKVFPPERTPTSLPNKIYSSTIVQIAPFGIRIIPGAKLTFPNSDQISKDAHPRLYRYDQTPGSKTVGEFVDEGPVTLSADGRWLETEERAIKETSYYFVSVNWPTATVEGRVLGSDRRPAMGASVIARGQFTYTDGIGKFVLKDVPVVRSGAPAIVETIFLRPDGNVLKTEKTGVRVTANEKTTIETDLVLPIRAVNNPPQITPPGNLSIRAGETRNFGIKVTDPESGKKTRVSVSGARFATIIPQGILWCKNHKLRLEPKATEAGEYKLTLTAVDSLGVRSIQTVSVKVLAYSSKSLRRRQEQVFVAKRVYE